ncbi:MULTISPECIES: restriction endonuclease subunit S [unclassified Streptomyces]|uniref:restriction endonuclease subunit S n=1 Tax=unclassified Streptomyces TaxID=2593676 RepID=UPI000DAF2E9F|nr:MULTISPECIES: restriction endonuclease subunit S [unclassified Streptomyces]PZT72473.1 hypothetical protein DNK55_28525 [Streptomyces sp. AC1-42T]PZT81209.1 hypothetical protein DNK56_03045 [Streptomyces sp. AC1-42W]
MGLSPDARGGLRCLPEGWHYRPLEDLLEPRGIAYGIVQPGTHDPTGVPVVRVKDVRRGRIGRTDVLRVARRVEANYERTRLRGGELLLSLVGSVGEVAVVPSDLAGWNVARAIAVLRPALVSSAWLKLYLMSEPAQGCMRDWQNTTVQATLNLRDVRRIPVALPPERERRAITEVLGALDDKIALNERICATVLDLGDSYHHKVSHQGAAPVATFGQLVAEGSLQFGDGYRTKKAEHGTPGLPILRVAEVGMGAITPSFGDHVREEFRSAMGRKTSRPGDVVLTTKGTVGRVAMISSHDAEFVYSPQVCFFRPVGDAPLSAPYLFHWLRGPEFWGQAAGMKGQTDMADYLSLSDIRSLKISLPTESELAAFDRQCAPLHARAEAARLENRTLATLRDTLLPQLVTGKIRVKDATRVVEEAV